jgi:protein O-GlcNAc transferase
VDTRLALELHRNGRLVEAEAAYQLSLSRDPGDARAWHFLGMLLCQTRRPAEGLSALQRSVQLAPDVAEFHNNLAGALGSGGKHTEAESVLHRVTAVISRGQPRPQLASLRLLAQSANP